MTAKRSGLGRGLESLIGTVSKAAGPAKDIEQGISAQIDRVVMSVPVDRLIPGGSQPRHEIDPKGIEELAASISQEGILVPLIARRHKKKEGFYEIVAGERRWRAARLAKLESVPVLVRDVADEAALVLSLIENIQREDLNPIEEAEAFQALTAELDLTQDDLAKRLGKERSSVANIIRLLKLPGPVRQLLQSRRLGMGHSRAILGLSDPEQMVELATRVVEQGLSVRQTEALVRRMRRGGAGTSKARGRMELYAHLAQELRRKLGTRVAFKGSEKKGWLEIHYFSKEELERIVELIGL